MDREEKNEQGIARLEETNGDDSQASVGRVTLIHIIKRRPWVMVGVILLVISVVALTLFLSRGSINQGGRPVPAPGGGAVPAPGGGIGGTQARPGEIIITLTPDKIASAQIKTEAATEQTLTTTSSAGGPRTTGTVQSNAYKEVPVLPIAGGIVRAVTVQLGDRAGRGQSLATIFSTELATAQGDYLKMLAELEEHHKHHKRAIELVEIGAMSREELERATTMYKTAEANVSSARQRLILLGMSTKQVDALRTTGQINSLISVPAPVAGTIISRTVNLGEVVATGKELFRVADLSTVWVIGQVYENDVAKVSVGTPAVIIIPAYAGRTLTGRVSYVDPRVDPNSRTAQVRIEVANPREILKLGMFVDVNFGSAAPTGTSGLPVVVAPRVAVQTIGTKQVVFVATDKPGVFVQREVTTGSEANGLVPIYSGVSAGEQVVTEGSFLLRAESLKLNPQQSMSPASAVEGPDSRVQGSPSPRGNSEPGTLNPEPKRDVQTATVSVTEKGYQPDTITLKRGIPARITFVREVEATCGTEVVIPEFKIKRDLPFKEPVVVEFTPAKKGVYKFTCGMGMLEGKLVVR